MPKGKAKNVVGTEIRRRRRAFDWNQARLAERASIDLGTISRLERGATKTAKMETIAKIDDALKAGGAIVALYSGVTPADNHVAHTRHASAGETHGRQEGVSVDQLFGSVLGLLRQMSRDDQNRAVVHFVEYLQTLESFPFGDETGHHVANQH